MNDLDPRTKLTIILSLSSLTIIFDKFFLLCGLLLISILLTWITIGSYIAIVRILEKMWPLFLSLAITLTIFASFSEALTSILRIIIIAISALILTTTSPRDFIQALLSWRIPYEIAFMVMVATRFLFIFREEAKDTFLAVQMRGVEINKLKYKEKIELYISLLLPLVFSAISKAYKLAIAMEARGLRAYPQRSFFRQLRLKKIDYCLMASTILATVIVIFINI